MEKEYSLFEEFILLDIEDCDCLYKYLSNTDLLSLRRVNKFLCNITNRYITNKRLMNIFLTGNTHNFSESGITTFRFKKATIYDNILNVENLQNIFKHVKVLRFKFCCFRSLNIENFNVFLIPCVNLEYFSVDLEIPLPFFETYAPDYQRSSLLRLSVTSTNNFKVTAEFIAYFLMSNPQIEILTTNIRVFLAMKFYFQRQNRLQRGNNSLHTVEIIISHGFTSSQYLLSSFLHAINSFNIPHIHIKMSGTKRFKMCVYTYLYNHQLIGNRLSMINPYE